MRLIDADALLEAIRYEDYNVATLRLDNVSRLITNAPTVQCESKCCLMNKALIQAAPKLNEE